MKKDPEHEAGRWFAQAEAELKDARYLSDGGRFYLALFLTQQSAEKALKAFLFSRNIDPIFTHSVTELISAAETLDPDFSRLKEARKLDMYYIPTRYPNGLPGDIPSQYYDDPKEDRKSVV